MHAPKYEHHMTKCRTFLLRAKINCVAYANRGKFMKSRLSHFFCLMLIFAALYYHPANYWRSCWWDKWFFVIAACSIFSAANVGRMYHWSLGLSLGYTLLSALWAFGWGESYPNVDLVTLISIGKITAYTFIAVLSVTSTLLWCGEKELDDLRQAFTLICVLNTTAIIIQRMMGIPRVQLGGLFGNPSMAGCFTAFTYPLVLYARPLRLFKGEATSLVCAIFLLVSPLVAVFLAGTSQPVVVIALVMLACVAQSSFKDKGTKRELATFGLSSLLVLALFFGVGILTTYKVGGDLGNSGGFFGDSGRHEIWKLALKSWWHTGHVWLGQGTGISQILLPLIQVEATKGGFPHDLWLWFHSDFLQALFENGVVGFLLGLTMVFFALKSAWKKSTWLFACLFGVLSASIFNFTAHLPLHAFFGAFVICASFHPIYLRKGKF